MWMCDLEKAIPKVNECLGVDRGYVLIESIKPCADGGIAFALSDGGYIKWFPDGEIVRRGKDDWRTPPSSHTQSAQPRLCWWADGAKND